MSKYSNITETFVQNFDLVADLISFKTKNKPTKLLTKKKTKQPFMTVNFVNKGIEMVNLSRILNTEEIKNCLPFKKKKDHTNHTPRVSHSYTPTIRSKILNYKPVL